MKLKLNIPGIPTDKYRWYVASDQSTLFRTTELINREDRIIRVADMNFERDSKSRTLFFMPIGQERRLFVKRFKIHNLTERVKSFFTTSKARYEFKIYRYLKAKNIPIANPIAYLEKRKLNVLKESYLFTSEIKGAVTLKDYILNKGAFVGEKVKEKDAVLQKLAALIRQLHNSNFYHEDLHVGNILIQVDEQNNPKLYITDFHSGRISVLSSAQKINNLGRLCYSLRLILSVSDVSRFLIYYRTLDFRKETVKYFIKQVLDASEKVKHRHWQSRTRRCIKKSTEFNVYKENGLKVYHKRAFHVSSIKQLIDKHKSMVEGSPRSLFKVTPKRCISLLTLNGQNQERFYVKEYIYNWRKILANLFRNHRAKSDWISHHGLMVRGMLSPKAVFMAQVHKGPFIKRAYLVTREVKDTLPSNQYAVSKFAHLESCDKKAYAKRFAEIIARVHQRGILHADLKANNILVGEDFSQDVKDWLFYILDLDRVEFPKNISLNDRIKNLAQLNAATPGVVTRADRLRFFRYYIANFKPFTIGKQKELVSEIMKTTIERNHFWPEKKNR